MTAPQSPAQLEALAGLLNALKAQVRDAPADYGVRVRIEHEISMWLRSHGFVSKTDVLLAVLSDLREARRENTELAAKLADALHRARWAERAVDELRQASHTHEDSPL